MNAIRGWIAATYEKFCSPVFPRLPRDEISESGYGLPAGVCPSMGSLGQTNSAPSPARLEVVISRFVGETKVGSHPFSFLLKTGEKGSLMMESTGSADSEAPKPCAAAKTPPTGTQVDASIRLEADDSASS
jgi:hypothetical protein